MDKTDLAVYFVAGTQDMLCSSVKPSNQLLLCLESALMAGITCFQLREKGHHSLKNADEVSQLAKDCQQLCQRYHVPFFINDNVTLALDVGADGIHVGQDDMPIEQVIQQCQGRLYIGLSVNTLAQAVAANTLDNIDYLGVGPIFPTTSKADAQAVTGTELIRQIRQAGITKPLVGIGGINTANAYKVRAAGADGVAVISAITQSDDLNVSIQFLLSFN